MHPSELDRQLTCGVMLQQLLPLGESKPVLPGVQVQRHQGILMVQRPSLACGRGRGRGGGLLACPVDATPISSLAIPAQQYCNRRQVMAISELEVVTPNIPHFHQKHTSDFNASRSGKPADIFDSSKTNEIICSDQDCKEQEQKELDNEDSSNEESNDSMSNDLSLKSCNGIHSQGKKANKQGRNDARWLENYEQLKKYKESYGDCVVPRGYSPDMRLASWVAEQRKQYQRVCAGKASSITPDRIALLNELHFTWNAQEASWDRHMRDLQLFRAEHGHCHVPHDHPQFPKLGLWVKEQRRHYSLMKQGRTSHMNEQRVAALDGIGFCWDTHEATWLERLRELIEFKRTFGNCVVPTNYPENPKLGTWAHHQRRQYKLFRDGQPCHITPERIKALESLDFVWNTRCCRITGSDCDAEDPLMWHDQEKVLNLDLRPKKRRRRSTTN